MQRGRTWSPEKPTTTGPPLPWPASQAQNSFASGSRSPREVPLDDAEDFSLYRTLVVEDPFSYSNSLHLDFLGAFCDDDVHTVLDRLPPLYRAPLVLRYVEGLPTKQIARALELPLGTVLSQLHRGRKLFEYEMWEYARDTGVLAAPPTPERTEPA